MIDYSSSGPNLLNIFECTGVSSNNTSYLIIIMFAMFHALQCSFCVTLVFMQEWSRDNPYHINMFDYTDDIHLHYFHQSLCS